MTYILSSDLTQKTWAYFRTSICEDDVKIIHNFNYEHLRSKHRQKFESWLWDQGGIVKRKDHKSYIQFMSGQHMTWFMLKHNL